MELLRYSYRGSVKDIRTMFEPTATRLGMGFFEYSDRYSVFDWGEMPDLLQGKGASLALMARHFFEQLSEGSKWDDLVHSDIFDSIEDKDFVDSIRKPELIGRLTRDGLLNHHRNFITTKKSEPATSFTSSDNELEVELVRVIRPELKGGAYDYSWYEKEIIGKTNYLIPFEVVFRFGVPGGSSLLERIGDAEYLHFLGLRETPKENEMLPHPVIEFSTKLEPSDRYVKDWATVQKYSGLTDEQFNTMQDLTYLTAIFIADSFRKIGVEVWDGKLEWALTPKMGLMLVDAVGPDELRLMRNGVQVSKEPIRQWYKKYDREWCERFSDIKKGYAENPRAQCERQGYKPKKLPADFKKTVEQMYMALTAEITGSKIFGNLPSLDEITRDLKAHLEV